MNNFNKQKTFSINEPETLEWIDQIPNNSVFWDIGANIGLYSIYAAKKRNCSVFAFEPSVFNLEVLARNIFKNNIVDKVKIIPIAVSDSLGNDIMSMTSTEWGGALSSFGKDFSWNGEKIEKNFIFNTFGIKIDQAVSLLKIKSPDYIKLDVDGIEHIILQGGEEVLKKVKGILIEINDDFSEQANIAKKLLQKAGLQFKHKKQSELHKNSVFKNTFNQIWVRN